jgi:hypothetical protein
VFECGVCVGSGILDGACDCFGNILDCESECGGTAVEDNFGNCCETVDCTGECNGDAEVDECGLCEGSGIPEGDCDCEGNVNDCSDECGGDAQVDECGICDNNSSNDCTQDCAGEWGGNAVEDCLGECNGTSIEDCAGECNGSAVVDECGECQGDNSSCDGCMDPLACNYNEYAIVDDGDCIYSNEEYECGFSLNFDNVNPEAGTIDIIMNNQEPVSGFTLSKFKLKPHSYSSLE